VKSAEGTESHEFDLVGLLAGELTRDETIAVGRHLRTCAPCREELADLAVAHGSLQGAAGAMRGLDEGSAASPATAPLVGTELAQPLPALSADALHSARRQHRSRRTGAVVASIAAACVLVAGVTTAVVHGQHGSNGNVVASASLKPIDAPPTSGGTIKALANGSSRELIVSTAGLSAPPAQHFYEVWLLDPASQKMLPVGVLPPSGTGNFTMPASIMAGYSAVDVSLQQNNGNPAHSETSVLRANF
jgi:anti-sigma factor RsiW